MWKRIEENRSAEINKWFTAQDSSNICESALVSCLICSQSFDERFNPDGSCQIAHQVWRYYPNEKSDPSKNIVFCKTCGEVATGNNDEQTINSFQHTVCWIGPHVSDPTEKNAIIHTLRTYTKLGRIINKKIMDTSGNMKV
jgi:hypothetical protein